MREIKPSSSIVVPVLLIVIAISGLIASTFLSSSAFLTVALIRDSLLYPLLRLFVYLGIGLLVGEFIETLGWTSKIAGWMRPLIRWAHLKDESGAVFITSFVSGIGANTLLMTFYENGKINRREVTLTYLLNTGLPLFLLHLPTTFFLTATLAGAAGMVYVAVTLIAAMLRSVIILIYCRLKLPDTCWSWSPLLDEAHPEPDQPLKRILFKFRSRFYRVALYTFPIYVLVFLLNQWGFFRWLNSGFSLWMTNGMFPVEATGMVIFSLTAEFGAGMATAGALLDQGALNTKQAALALILGTIIATPIRALRHQFATHVGLFSLGFGAKLLALSQGFRIVSLTLVAFVYAIIF